MGAVIDPIIPGVIALMRENHVIRFADRTSGLELELHPSAWDKPAEEVKPKPGEPLPENAPCYCGHMPYEHSDLGCLRGCTEEKCQPPEQGVP